MAAEKCEPVAGELSAIESPTYVDPNGYLFELEEGTYRAIYDGVADFYRELFARGIVERLVENNGLVPSWIVESPIDAVPESLVLRHERIEPLTYCVEWCPSMLQRAALQLLELSMALLDHDCMLQDAYPWNTLYRGTGPVFVDFTSIVPVDGRMIWPAHGQFEEFFLRPLLLSQWGKWEIARLLLFDNITGVSRRQFLGLAPISHKVLHAGTSLSQWLDGFLQSHPGARRKLKEGMVKAQVRVDRRVRDRFFGRLYRKIDGISITSNGDVWQDYYQSLPQNVDRRAKHELVGRVLRRLAPSTVLDLGANTGSFSVMAAEEGAQVTAIDSSTACMERLFRYATEKCLKVLPLVADVLCPTPAFGFLGEQYPYLFDRVRSDTVLCLGLMHHLHITGRQSFERIAKMLDQVSTRAVIFEYVDPSDPMIELLDTRVDVCYSLGSVRTSLATKFALVEEWASDRPTRRILVLEKRE